MTTAHALPGPGDLPTPAGTTAAPEEEPAAVELLDAVPAPAGPVDQDQAAEPGEELEDLDDAGKPGEEAPPRPALVLPDLRPYALPDRDTLAELGSLAADVTRTTVPLAGRGLAPLLRAGGVALRAWFTGELAPKVPTLWRLVLVPLLVVYLVAQTVARYPWTPLLLIPALPLAAVLAHRWAARQTEAAAKASGKGGGKGPAEASGKTGKGSPKEASKTPAKSTRKTLTARLAAALSTPPAEASPETPTEPPAEAPEQPEETPSPEAPPTPSRDDLVRALHALIGGSSGVLHTALRDRLRYPSTRAVREALEAAHIPSRSGVRAVGGNGPGVHRRDIPPLPPPQEGPPGSGVVAGQGPTTTPTTRGEGSGEGLGVDGSDQAPAYPFDVVPDPERGPSAWRVVPHD